MKVACLVGNGTSMVYNPELAIDALTDGIKAAYGTLGGTAAAMHSSNSPTLSPAMRVRISRACSARSTTSPRRFPY